MGKLCFFCRTYCDTGKGCESCKRFFCGRCPSTSKRKMFPNGLDIDYNGSTLCKDCATRVCMEALKEMDGEKESMKNFSEKVGSIISRKDESKTRGRKDVV